MRPLKGSRQHSRREVRDFAPSRLAYRVQRLWLTPGFRRFLRVGLPALAVLTVGTLHFSDATNRQAVVDGIAEIRREIANRPEFRINLIGIEGATPALAEEIRAVMNLPLPISSFDVDLDLLRYRIAELPAVREAELQVRSGGYLAVEVVERDPAMIWQTRGGPVLLDREGIFVGALEDRQLTEPLPMVSGLGADRAISEAFELFAAARPALGDRLLGLTRVGERRWDVVLTEGPRIQLPAEGAVEALDRVLALDDAQELLSRDIVRVDMRLPHRPTVQLSPGALEEFRRLRELQRVQSAGGGQNVQGDRSL